MKVSHLATLNPDTTQVDTQRVDNPIKSPVYRTAEDSIKADWKTKKVYLYGKAQVIYEDITLNADLIIYDLEKSLVIATYTTDSLGEVIGKPVFTDGNEEIHADTIKYNFKTKRGIIKKVRTQVAEGFIDGELVVKDADDVLYIKDGRYCPCEDPDAYTKFRVTKIKVMDELIVTGPGYLEMAGIPTPIMFPFGFFPNKKQRNAGLLIPAFTEDQNFGFGLKDGGFYWPINDHIDAQFTGDIFTSSSWRLANLTRYNKRYKRSGEFGISYSKNKYSDPEYPDYSEQTNFWVTWRHQQDRKAHPYNNFNARINAGSSGNFRNNLTTTPTEYLSNQFNSNINYTRSFAGKPFNLALGANHNQNTQTGVVNVTLPSMSFNVNRVYIAKWFNKNGEKRSPLWKSLEKIGATVRMEGVNRATMVDTLIALNNLDYVTQNMRNGFRHNTTINTSMRLLGSRFTLTPAATWVGRYYFDAIEQSYDTSYSSTNNIRTDTVSGFYYNDNYNFSAGITTKLYGYYSLMGPKKRVFRHVMTPKVSFTYRPDFDPRKSFTYTDTTGSIEEHEYNPYVNGVYGSSPVGESGLLNFSLINTLGMKVNGKLDSTGAAKKVSLIENFNISTGYNFIADSMNLSNIRMAGRTTLFKIFNINLSSVWDPYRYDELGLRRKEFAINTSGNILRLTDANLAAGIRLTSKKAQNKNAFTQNEKDELNALDQDPFDFLEVPWALQLNYSVNYDRDFYNLFDEITGDTNLIDSVKFVQTLRFNGDFSLTPKWRFTFSSNYDFVNKTFTYTTVSIERDLNCWQARFNWVPFGQRRMYSLTIALKNPLLRDVKYTRQRTWYDQDFF